MTDVALPFDQIWIKCQQLGDRQCLEPHEAAVLYRAACGLPQGSLIVEVGTGSGRSACVLGSAAAACGGHVTTIDDWSWPFDRQRTCDDLARLSMPIEQITGRSESMPWSRGEIGLLFVDGSHHEAGIDGDCRLWLPRIRGGGLAAFHDYGEVAEYEGIWPGHDSTHIGTVTRVVDRMMAGWACVDRCGFLAVFRKPVGTRTGDTPNAQ